MKSNTPFRNSLRGVFISLGLVAAATVLRLLIDPLLGDAQAFTIYFAAVALAAWAGGFWPALLAIVLSYFTADWFFITPRHAFNWPKFALDDFLALGGFVISGLAIAVTSEAMRRAVARGNAKQRLLEQEVGERKKAELSLQEAQLALQHHNEQLEKVVAERTATMRENLESLESVCYHMAHDLRAPLRAMSGFSQVVMEESGPSLSEASRIHLEQIRAASRRMDQLILGLLEYGRVGQERLNPRPVTLQQFLSRLLGAMNDQVSESHAIVEVREPLQNVIATESLLDVILKELLENAFKFIHEGTAPAVAIFTEPRGPKVRIVIQDHGIGVPTSYQEKIFRLFEQLEKNRYGGEGIGLAIVAKAIKRMNGQVGVDAEPGKGSRFWIELPAA